ncbi:hypothetical protein TD95_001195 [Thielaviopsis punctulata]|uniref:Major facilitator superfamily (MFS) profile domain-containing protein n=1 Tax=Thielaviopsis punctulata TaxID=72032 RepID=A0A0F4ZBQ2_9PEZI|nr:hypothetical protein TD95_001195 [Thielaviopsis punctulata]
MSQDRTPPFPVSPPSPVHSIDNTISSASTIRAPPDMDSKPQNEKPICQSADSPRPRSDSLTTANESDSNDSDSTCSQDLHRYSTHASVAGHDAVAVVLEEATSHVEIPDSVYDRFTPQRKRVMVALLAFCSFLAPISSTSVLAASPEVAAEFNTTGTIINLSNAMYMLSMGLCPAVWGPFNTVYGRRPTLLICASLFFLCSIGTALAPNLPAFFFFRIASAFEGTAFILVGSACIGDIYRPTERGTALGWFLSGSLIGPAFGPFMGGIIVTFTSWRVIFWLQTGLAAIGLLGSIFIIPETIYHKKISDLEGYSRKRKARALWSMINPARVFELYRYPNLLLAGIAAASIIWNMYSLLTPIRYVLNPRFNLTSPMMGGLFYLAPGCGYLTGSFMGGRYADYTVRKWMEKRGGERIPEDRLRSAIPFMGIVIPVCILMYGWCVEKDIGGIPMAVIPLFFQGVAQLFCFPSINTYCLDVNQSRSAEVVAGNYLFRYVFAAGGSAVVLPAIEAIGVGWYTTISAGFLIVSVCGLMAVICWGKKWRDDIDNERRRKRTEARLELGNAKNLA